MEGSACDSGVLFDAFNSFHASEFLQKLHVLSGSVDFGGVDRVHRHSQTH